MISMFAKLGTVFYVIWGILHIEAAYEAFVLGSTIDQGVIQGKIFQDAWNLLFFALFAITVAARYNWKNSRLGYWLNLIVVSAADIGFVIFVLIPGNVAFFPGVLGPVFWLLAVASSTIGILKEPRNS